MVASKSLVFDHVGILAPFQFVKYHGLGNDYLVMDDAALTAVQIKRVIAWCHRHTGVGADGILVKVPSKQALFGVRIFNPDGTEAEKSGNGLRIFARAMYDLHYTREQQFDIETKSGVVHVTLHVHNNDVTAIAVNMGRASFLSTDIPMPGPPREVIDEPLTVGQENIQITAVSIGNPHCVWFVEHLDLHKFHTLAKDITVHPNFLHRTNVQMACVRNAQHIDILIWERGVGPTLASGSSSCAVAAAAYRLGYTQADMTIEMKGGCLSVSITKKFDITMTGPATPICQGFFITDE